MEDCQKNDNGNHNGFDVAVNPPSYRDMRNNSVNFGGGLGSLLTGVTC